MTFHMRFRKVFSTATQGSKTGKAITALLAVAAMAGTFAACSAFDSSGSSDAEFRSADNGPPQKYLPYFNR